MNPKKNGENKTISQTDANCVILTGKTTKHATKSMLVDAAMIWKTKESMAKKMLDESAAEIIALNSELKAAKETQRRAEFTEVPTEELNDVITDVRYISENLRKIVLDRVDNNHKADLLMDCFQADERVHAFCIGRANASIETIKEYA